MLNPKGEVDGEGYLKRGTREVPSLRQDVQTLTIRCGLCDGRSSSSCALCGT